MSDRELERRRLGRAIRTLRTARELKLIDVAEAAGVSVSLLSQVERGLLDPSLESLRNIAEALGTTPFQLLSTDEAVAGIVRSGQGRQIVLPDTDISYELLSPSADGAFEVLRWELAPGGVGSTHRRGHRGEEATVVLAGSLVVEIGDERIRLEQNDCITFDARVPHRAVNVGDSVVVGLSIVCPPSF